MERKALTNDRGESATMFPYQPDHLPKLPLPKKSKPWETNQSVFWRSYDLKLECKEWSKASQWNNRLIVKEVGSNVSCSLILPRIFLCKLRVGRDLDAWWARCLRARKHIDNVVGKGWGGHFVHKGMLEGGLLFVRCPLEGLVERKCMANLVH